MKTNEKILSFYQGKKVFITGDTGFKGSWLSIWLLHLGAEITGYALPTKSKEGNYILCGLKDRINHIDGDICNLEKLHNSIKKCQPSIVFHFAAQPLVLESYKNPILTLETNILGTAKLLEAARGIDSIRSIVIVTSDKCYDNKEWVHGYRETDPLGGHDPYSASKAAAEIITSSYRQSFFKDSKCSIATVRAGNVIGGGDWAQNRIVPDCIRSFRKNKEIFLRNPSAVRPWQYVLEPLHGYLHLGKALFEKGGAFSGGWNFGPRADSFISVRSLVDLLIKKQQIKVSVKSLDERNKKVETNFLNLDISKSLNFLSWKPVLSIDKAIQLCSDDYSMFSKGNVAYQQRIDRVKEYCTLFSDVSKK